MEKKILTLFAAFSMLIASAAFATTDVPDATTVSPYSGDPYAVTGLTNYSPYQSSYNLDYLKDVLLRRVANDPYRFKNSFVLIQSPPSASDGGGDAVILGSVPDPVFGRVARTNESVGIYNYDYGGLSSFIRRNKAVVDRHYPEGAALTTNNSAEITNLFKNVANRIKLKLIS